MKDQGFTRAKALIIVGFRHMAFDIVEAIVHLANRRGQWKGVKGRKKFKQVFTDPDASFDDDFHTGIGLQINKTGDLEIEVGTGVYESDIIVASPIALRSLTGLSGSADNESKVHDFDFLSSLEFLVIDQAEAFNFQNPEHLEEVLKILNRRPKKLAGLNDINRLKLTCTETAQGYAKQKLERSAGLSKLFRQTIILQKF